MTPTGAFRFSPRPNRAEQIPWQEWDAAIFEEAVASDRPVVLSLAADWAPSSHLLDETVFSDADVTRALASDAIPIRVDIDERPDIAGRYGDLAEPGIAVLTPEGVPARRLAVPTAEQLLDALLDARTGAPRRPLEAPGPRAAEGASAGGEISPLLLDTALARLEPQRELAGPEAVRLWLYARRRRGDLQAELRARAAIQRRVDGGGVDGDSGAFRHCLSVSPDCAVGRAAVQGEWLEVLARIAAEGAEARGWASAVVRPVIDFLERQLLGVEGGFRDTAGHDRVFAASNARVARGLIACGVVFDRPDWRGRGLTAVDLIVRRFRAGMAGVYHLWDGIPGQLGLLQDQVASGQALLDAYEVTGEGDLLAHAQELASVLERSFRSPEGALTDVDRMYDSTALLALRQKPLTDNAAAVELLTRLGHLTHDDRYPAHAYQILGALAGEIAISGDLEGVSALARVADRLLSREPEIKVIAESRPGEIDRGVDELHREALRMALAAHTVQRLYPPSDDELVRQLGVSSSAAGAVCFVGGQYGPLLTHPDQLLPAIEHQLENA